MWPWGKPSDGASRAGPGLCLGLPLVLASSAWQGSSHGHNPHQHGHRSLFMVLPLERQFSPVQFSSVQSLSRVRLCNSVDCGTPGFPVHHQLPELTQTHVRDESVMLSNHLIVCCPLLLLPSVFPSIRVFSNESVLLIRWTKYWSFSFSISPSNKYLGLISFRMDWLDLLAVQGTLKSLLQHHSSKA